MKESPKTKYFHYNATLLSEIGFQVFIENVLRGATLMLSSLRGNS